MNKTEWKQYLIDCCKQNETYRDTFLVTIETLAQILEQRDKVHDQYVEEGSQPIIVKYSQREGKKNMAKNPLLMLETDLNTQALAYLRQLGLTPASLKQMNDQIIEKTKKSVLEEALNGFNA